MNREESNRQKNFLDALKIVDVRLFIGYVGFFTMASRALEVVIGFQVYKITHQPFFLGLLGLTEAIPALTLAPFGGYVADHFNRHRILLITGAVSFICAVALALLSFEISAASLIALYFVIFLAGVARGFADPSGTAFEAQVVPKHLTVNAASWISSTWITCGILGPAAIGFIFDAHGASISYSIIAGAFIFSWMCMLLIPRKPQEVPQHREPVFKSIAMGWHFVLNHQPLLAAMVLDLFAVFFGGAIALLPVYAESILHVGARGLGILNAAPSLGALIITLTATRHPPMAKAGRNLMLAVAGFGFSILIFAFSKSFALSLIALFLSGVFDGISMVIRRSMVRLLSPDSMRGRVAAANWVFVNASNQLGAFESGMIAAWLGTVPGVAVGGLITLTVVALTAKFAKQLRNLRFDIHTLEQK